jgi:hypothetical protein
MTELHELLSRREVLEGLRRKDHRPLDEALKRSPDFRYDAEALRRGWQVLLREFPGLGEPRHPRYRVAGLVALHRALRVVPDEKAREAFRQALPPLGSVDRAEERLNAHYGSLANAAPDLEKLHGEMRGLHQRLTDDLKAALAAAADEEGRALYHEMMENHNNGFMTPLMTLQLLLQRARGGR